MGSLPPDYQQIASIGHREHREVPRAHRGVTGLEGEFLVADASRIGRLRRQRGAACDEAEEQLQALEGVRRKVKSFHGGGASYRPLGLSSGGWTLIAYPGGEL